jgi:hypothetical protein
MVDALERKAAGTPLVYCDAFDLARRLERDRADLIAALEALRGAGEVQVQWGALFLKSNADFYKSLDQARATLVRVRS